MEAQMLDASDITLVFLLNPVTWIVVFILAVRSSNLWKPALIGVIVHF